METIVSAALADMDAKQQQPYSPSAPTTTTSLPSSPPSMSFKDVSRTAIANNAPYVCYTIYGMDTVPASAIHHHMHHGLPHWRSHTLRNFIVPAGDYSWKPVHNAAKSYVAVSTSTQREPGSIETSFCKVTRSVVLRVQCM
jgi:hypothetical protein